MFFFHVDRTAEVYVCDQLDKIASDFVSAELTTYTLMIPYDESCGNEVVVELVSSEQASPNDLGMWNDRRNIGFRVGGVAIVK